MAAEMQEMDRGGRSKKEEMQTHAVRGGLQPVKVLDAALIWSR